MSAKGTHNLLLVKRPRTDPGKTSDENLSKMLVKLA